MTPHRYADWDAAYVLGALSSADRSEYEDHLAGCKGCRDAVAELAGVPGLLSTVSPAEVLAIDIPDSDVPESATREPSTASPDSAEPSIAEPAAISPTRRFEVIRSPKGDSDHGRADLGRRMHAGQGRRWLAVAAALVALGGAGLGGYALSDAQHPTTSVVSGPTRLAFSPVTPSTMTAVVDVAPVGDHTSVKVECQYSASGGAGSSWADYSVWAVGRDGHAALVTTWRAQPDEVMHPSGTAPLPTAQIAAIEIRLADSGQTVMRAALG
ncbi:MAG: zf-HC2 domain-containing protein [Intrasporangium sp.]|uniref:zf-HC2 domain-containing protein n=1 Tax=Intrasporangium sp. TaxID=1925024 RepID=UPI003F80A77E